MRTIILILVSLMLLLGLSQAVPAETEFKISGQVRFRSESDKRSFDTLAAVNTPSYGRVRLGVEAVVDSNVRAFVQLQDSRVFGGVSPAGDRVSGTTNNGFNIDLHQGYLELPHLIGQRIGLKLGRFEVAWHNERLMGAVDWNNVGRSWEGGQAWYRAEKFSLDVYLLDARRQFSVRAERSLFVIGALASIKPYKTDLFLITDLDYLLDHDSWAGASRTTVGVYTKQNFFGWDLELTGALQNGKVPYMLSASASGQDVSSYMIQSEVGYTLPSAGNMRLAAGVDYASGDENPFDSENKAFDNLYYTGHKFRGYMDYFSDPNSPQFAGLIDLYGRMRFEPTRGWVVGGDVHYFQPAEEQFCTDCGPFFRSIEDIGWEFDFIASTTRVKGAKLEGGWSAFFPTESFAGYEDPDPGYWGYFQAIVNF